ncbi:MAG: glycosyltransferase [Syntrophobacter sp.]
MRILFYCQHVLGIGHFFRSMEIAGALDRHEILFVGGGESLVGFTTPPHVRMLCLPALMMDPDFKAMHSSGGALEEVRGERVRILLDAFSSFGPDVVLTELFPFGRRQFKFELMPLLKLAREGRQYARVVCSLRDILVEKDKPGYEQEVVDLLNQYYDLLLVHSDPEVASLDETFSLTGHIRIPVEYTGFVARPSADLKGPPGQGKTIVASSGGGRVGSDLLAAVILAMPKIRRQDITLKVFAGPFMEGDDRARLENLAKEDPRIKVLPFSLDFPSELARADLSISMAGYNTCMDILSAGVPAIVYPFPRNREQGMRAKKLKDLGLLRVIDSPDPDRLASEIKSVMGSHYLRRVAPVNLSGAANTARLIENLLGAE